MQSIKRVFKMQTGLTLGELLMASTIALIVVGGIFSLWFMTQDTWTNERTKSEILQNLQVTVERIKREMKISDGGRMFFHTSGSNYDAVSFPIALDDGRSDAGYSESLDGDGFIETDSSTRDPITGVEKIWWDKTVIYHIYYNGSDYELRRTDFYPRDNSLTTAERQTQIDNVVTLGTGNDNSVPNYLNWENTRTIFKASSLSFEVVPRLREFDSYSSTTERTENIIDFGSTILDSGYHTITFRVTDKNAASIGYAFGIDSLKFTPPGSTREVEKYISLTHPDGSSGIDGSSGDAGSAVKMYNSEYGLWSADYYLDYAANAVDDYLTLRFYYDRWYETTFLDGVSDNLVLEFSNNNGRGGTSGAEEWLLVLEGNEITWDTPTQTQASTSTNLTLPENGGDITYRNLIMGNYITADGMMVSVKFCAGNNYPLTIESAYIIQKNDSGGSPDDGSSAMPSIPITFSSCSADPRNLGQSGIPSTTTGYDVTIPAGCYAWSNYIKLYSDAGDPEGSKFNLDKMKDYFISFYIPLLASEASMSYWQDSSSSPITQSFTRAGKHDGVAIWSGAGTETTSIYGIEEIDISYVDSGSFNSNIFDTGVDDPSYGYLTWSAVINNPDATLNIRVRSSDSDTELGADADWALISGQTFPITSGSGSTALAGVGTGRYVQFRAEFAAFESNGDTSHQTHDAEGGDNYDDDEDYDLSCVLKDVSIYWPGNTAMVDVGGYFTKKPDYGIFTVEIDGQQLTKGFVINLSITEDLTTGETVSRSITAEVEPRNTNK